VSPAAKHSSGASTRGDEDEAPPLLELFQVTKSFPGVVALDRVDFQLRAGEVHVLFGENGAGKSTLIALVAGVHKPTSGEIRLHGEPAHLQSVHDARTRGISAVFQEFSLVPTLSVEQNLFLGSEKSRLGLLQKRRMLDESRDILERLGFSLDLDEIVMHLSRAEQQMVEIAKAFRDNLSVLILDEPTASLTERETAQLFKLVKQARADGVGVIYITHRMSEIRQIGDRVTVLRDGEVIDTVDARSTPDHELVRLMTGRRIDEVFPKIDYAPATAMLEVENLTTASGTVRNAGFEVRAGEIVGVAGLVGSGKSQAARACFGLETIATGRVRFKGEDVTGATPRAMMDRGLFYIPPDRRDEGLVMIRSCRENVSLPSLTLAPLSRGPFLDHRAERDMAERLTRRLNLQPPNIERLVEHFSGGNQQKVLLAKSLTRDVDLFVFDEPTVGVDVATRVAIYEFIRDLCHAGKAVLLISSDLPEILHLTNRVYVMYRGVIQAHIQGEEITEATVLRHMFEREAA
jgi:ribose transport system ATP-binding protein